MLKAAGRKLAAVSLGFLLICSVGFVSSVPALAASKTQAGWYVGSMGRMYRKAANRTEGFGGYVYQANVKGNKLIIRGALENKANLYTYSENVKLTKDKKFVFKLTKKTGYYSTGGDGAPQKLSKKTFQKYVKQFVETNNGLGLEIKVDQKGNVKRINFAS